MATLLKTVQGYVSNRQKSGATGLRLILTAIEHAFEHGDSTPLAWLIAKTEDKEGKVIRRIVGACVSGVSLEMTSEEARRQPSGIIIRGFEGGTKRKAKVKNEIGLLSELVAAGHGFMSKAVADALFPAPEKKDTYGLKEAVASFNRLVKKIEDHEMTLDMVLRAVAAETKVNADLDKAA